MLGKFRFSEGTPGVSSRGQPLAIHPPKNLRGPAYARDVLVSPHFLRSTADHALTLTRRLRHQPDLAPVGYTPAYHVSHDADVR